MHVQELVTSVIMIHEFAVGPATCCRMQNALSLKHLFAMNAFSLIQLYYGLSRVEMTQWLLSQILTTSLP